MEGPRNSKYIKNKRPRPKKPIRRKPVGAKNMNKTAKPYLNGRERYERYLERDKVREEMLVADEAESSAEISEAEKAVFSGNPARPKRLSPSGAAEPEELYDKQIAIRMIICCAVLTLSAIVLQFLSFRVPFTPLMLKLDLSALPELLAGVAYGPIAGIVAVVIKNLIYIAFSHGTANATAVSNTILDSLFIVIASLVYSHGMFSPKAIEKMFEKTGIR
ncbi:MAG: ECF transporter S component [Eubacterium sp.]|nr:ECF transporter S component [Eubacterium sp.]